MWKKLRTQLFVALAVLCIANPAQALTVAGVEYDEIFSLSTSDRIGYWVTADKFYTYKAGTSGATRVDVRQTSGLAALNGQTVQQAIAMGTTLGDNGPVNSGSVNFYGAGGVLLLSTSFIPNGSTNINGTFGTAGQIDFAGRLSVTGGSLAGLAIFSNPLYLQIAFDRVLATNANDLHATDGRFSLFGRSAPTGEVPEPASVALLLAGLAGAKRIRSRRTE